MKDLIKEVALEVAQRQGLLAYQVQHSMLINFATAFLAELSKRAEAVAWYDGNKFYANEKSAICGCADMGKLVKVFTFPPIHDIEPALFRYKRNTEGEDDLDPIERLRFFLSLALHGQDWIDVEPFLNDIEAIENRVAEACAKACIKEAVQIVIDGPEERAYNNATSDCAEAIKSGAWRKYK